MFEFYFFGFYTFFLGPGNIFGNVEKTRSTRWSCITCGSGFLEEKQRKNDEVLSRVSFWAEGGCTLGSSVLPLHNEIWRLFFERATALESFKSAKVDTRPWDKRFLAMVPRGSQLKGMKRGMGMVLPRRFRRIINPKIFGHPECL